MYPYGAPPPRAPLPPARRGLSPVVIVILVLGGVLVVGGGACVVIGGLVLYGAAAEDQAAPSPTATGAGPSMGDNPGPTPPSDSEQRPNAPEAPDPVAARPPPGGNTAATAWFCNATGSVRVCGFANVCNNMSVYGSGSGSDRGLASRSAKLACESQARAKGGTTTCSVFCSPATKP